MTVYEHYGCSGRSMDILVFDKVKNLHEVAFQDRISSVKSCT